VNRPHFRRHPRPVDPEPPRDWIDWLGNGLPGRDYRHLDKDELAHAAAWLKAQPGRTRYDDLHELLPCPICTPEATRQTRYDAQWPDVIAAEWPSGHQYPASDWLDDVPGGDLAAMAAPLPGMARDDLGTYAEPVEPRGRHRQTDPLDLVLADLRDLDGCN